MELQQRHSLTPNVNDAEEGETAEIKTEDIYQCLQYPPPGPQETDNTKKSTVGEGKGRKMMFLLIALVTLLLITIFILSAVHYSHFRQTLGVMNKQSTDKEVWLLHDNIFYLFWTDLGDCNTAERFCARRNASLTTVTQGNMAWLQSQIKGNRLVKRGKSEESGDFDYKYMDDEDSECDLLEVTPEQAEGWVAAQI